MTLRKNKLKKEITINYTGISLLGVTGKVFSRVVQSRIKSLAERPHPQLQCGPQRHVSYGHDLLTAYCLC